MNINRDFNVKKLFDDVEKIDMNIHDLSKESAYFNRNFFPANDLL